MVLAPEAASEGLPKVAPLVATVTTLLSFPAAAFYAVVWVAHEEYFRVLGLTPASVGLGQTVVVPRVAVFIGILAVALTAWIVVGMVAYRLTAAIPRGLIRAALVYGAAVLVAVVIPIIAIARLAGGPGYQLWGSGIVTAAVLAFLLSGFVNDPSLDVASHMRRAVDALYPASRPRVGRLLAGSIGLALIVVWTSNYVVDAERAGRLVRDTGVLPRNDGWFLNVITSPARVVPIGADPLKICDGTRRAVLVGRHGGKAFVVLVPASGAGPEAEVVPLAETTYSVLAARDSSATCSFP